MINNTLPLDENLYRDTAARAAPAFYVVSRKKLAILYLATLGLYEIYWFYKNWSNYKNHFLATKYNDVRGIWPAPRGFFGIFFAYSLLRNIKAYGRDNPVVAAWNEKLHAWKLIAFMLASEVLEQISGSTASVSTNVANLLVLAPLLVQLLRVQDMINASCGDPDGAGNSRFTTANYVWIALGLVLWPGVVIGLFLPDFHPF